MVQFIKFNLQEVTSIVASFRGKNRPLFSNYYGLSDDVECELYQSNNTVLIRKKEYEAYRLFLLTSDEDDLRQLLNKINDGFYVMNIPTREPITERIEMFKECGFELVAEYNRYYNKSITEGYKKLSKLAASLTNDDNYELVCNAQENEILQIWNLLNDTFDLYTDHIPNTDELTNMVKQKHVFVNKTSDGEIFGVHIFTPTNHICYGNAWVDKKGFGILLSKNMYQYALEHDIKTINYWIRKGNNQVIKYHKMLGAVPDGLSDFSFIKK